MGRGSCVEAAPVEESSSPKARILVNFRGGEARDTLGVCMQGQGRFGLERRRNLGGEGCRAPILRVS